MKDISIEALIKRIYQIEEKLFRYTETQADIYTLVVEITKALTEIKSVVKGMSDEVSIIIKNLKINRQEY